MATLIYIWNNLKFDLQYSTRFLHFPTLVPVEVCIEVSQFIAKGLKICPQNHILMHSSIYQNAMLNMSFERIFYFLFKCLFSS